jgi:hypothetical protein
MAGLFERVTVPKIRKASPGLLSGADEAKKTAREGYDLPEGA